MALHLIGKNLLLRLIAMLKQLLHDIVAKDVRHQLQAVWVNFAENLFLFIAVGRFELLLDEAGAVLVAAEFDHVVGDILAIVSN